MSSESEVLSDDVKKACAQLLERLVSESDSIETAVLASADGLMLAGTGVDNELDVMAAMSASLISLADAMSSRSDGGVCNKVLAESEDSSLVVLHAGGLILTVLGKPNANMGMVLAASRQVAEQIANIVKR